MAAVLFCGVGMGLAVFGIHSFRSAAPLPLAAEQPADPSATPNDLEGFVGLFGKPDVDDGGVVYQGARPPLQRIITYRKAQVRIIGGAEGTGQRHWNVLQCSDMSTRKAMSCDDAAARLREAR